jgi:hypothetical protein
LAHLLATHSLATPKQAKEPTFAAALAKMTKGQKIKRKNLKRQFWTMNSGLL